MRSEAVLLGAVTLLAMASTPAQQPPVSSIRVTSDAQVSAKPDRVQINIGVNTRAAQSQDAAAQNARETDAMLAALKKAAGPTAVLKTISYSLSPNYDYRPGGGEPTISGYTATNVVQVTLDDLGKIGSCIDAATQAGANHVQGIQFTLRDEEAVRAEALRQAAIKARAEAQVLAGTLGLKVVRVLFVEENSPRVTPIFHPIARTAALAEQKVPTPVESGTLDVTASVTLTVEVAPAAH
ncbi:MAG TPA: SIMPL domain-containing protein [Steroidobacteraceae bacterium]|nr:SIMPL domain-containing protein [Steroidobacteraceae bacterium]